MPEYYAKNRQKRIEYGRHYRCTAAGFLTAIRRLAKSRI
jgi:hypothetical protein